MVRYAISCDACCCQFAQDKLTDKSDNALSVRHSRGRFDAARHNTLVLPILSYGCEVWGVDTKCGAAAEALHQDFLRRLLGVRKSTANHMVSAELGRFPLQVHFWQQILRYHHRKIALDNVRLVKLAMVDGFALDQTAVKDSWQHYLGDFLHPHNPHNED